MGGGVHHEPATAIDAFDIVDDEGEHRSEGRALACALPTYCVLAAGCRYGMHDPAMNLWLAGDAACATVPRMLSWEDVSAPKQARHVSELEIR